MRAPSRPIPRCCLRAVCRARQSSPARWRSVKLASRSVCGMRFTTKARVLGGRGVGRRVRRCGGVLSDRSAYGYRRRRTGRFPSGTGHLCRCNGRKRRTAIQRPVNGGGNGRRLRSAGCHAIQTPSVLRQQCRTAMQGSILSAPRANAARSCSLNVKCWSTPSQAARQRGSMSCVPEVRS